MIPLFKAGDIDYSDMGLDKPVRYTVSDLKEIASQSSITNLHKGHTDMVIGVLKNFIVDGDMLKVEEPEGVNITGLGMSPAFEFELKDMGEYYKPVNITLKSVGLTENPRSKIYYNSVTDDKEDENMANENELKLMKDLQDANEEIRKQREEIGVLRNQKKSLEASLKKKNDIEDDLVNLKTENSKLKKDNEALKEKANQYDTIESEEREKLIVEIAKDDVEFKEELKDLPINTLRVLSSKKQTVIPPAGVGENGEPGIDDGTHKGNKKDSKPTYEEYQVWKKENGVR